MLFYLLNHSYKNCRRLYWYNKKICIYNYMQVLC